MWNTFGTTPYGDGFVEVGHAFGGPSTSADSKVEIVQNLVPLVTSLINECRDETFTLFGIRLELADIVGILRNYKMESSKGTCTIEDHTSSIKGVLDLEEDDDGVISLPPVKEGAYVRAYGCIRHQDGCKSLLIWKMFPVDDCNVVVNHLLQAVYVRLAAEKASKTGGSVIPNAGLPFVKVEPTTSDDQYGFNPLQRKVLKIIQRTPLGDNGIHKNDILHQFDASQAREVKEALKFLLNEGHAYTTTNSDRYEATDLD